MKSGELDGSTSGIWRITEKGRERYQREGSSYKQLYYKPVQRRKTRMTRRNSLRMTTKHLVHPSEATQEFLQQWGVKEGLNLFQLGFEGLRNKYWEFYQKRMCLSADKILRSVHKHEREIKAFLNGKLPRIQDMNRYVSGYISFTCLRCIGKERNSLKCYQRMKYRKAFTTGQKSWLKLVG